MYEGNGLTGVSAQEVKYHSPDLGSHEILMHVIKQSYSIIIARLVAVFLVHLFTNIATEATF